MDIIDRMVSDIKNLQIQGATNILKSSLYALRQWAARENNLSIDKIKFKMSALANARPTEPFVQNIFTSMIRIIEVQGINNFLVIISDTEKSLSGVQKKIVANGASVLKDKNIILTHCHSESVEEILKKLHEQNPALQVFVTETRPLYQGRTTGKHLLNAGLKVTMITDGEAIFMVSREDKQNVDAVLLGADAILRDGSIINKVGSYGISLSAWKAKIPLYVVATLLKFTPREIKIEERPQKEIWDNPPKNLIIFNPAFDKVPKEHITGIITEAGNINPKEVIEVIKKLYPWLT